jgi:NADPH:quinone reductase-like Zn-dependent oxidoreductase
MSTSATTTQMDAVVTDGYGPPSTLHAGRVDTPQLEEGRVLVRVFASSVNPGDWFEVTGTPLITRPSIGWRRPRRRVPGTDLAGVVEQVGAGVGDWQVGDEVFGGAPSAFAQVASVKATSISRKPATLSFAQAAAVPVAGLTALQALRDKGKVQPGQRVLINGAAGGVGTFAVQVAKSMGAHVTAVCSTRNVEMVRSLGADLVIDYTTQDVVALTGADDRFDVMIDNVGNLKLSECRRMLRATGIMVVVGGPKKGRVLGPAGRMVKALLAFAPVRQKAVPFVAKFNREDLDHLARLVSEGALTPVIDRTYPLADAGEALTYLGEGHARGKVVLTV